ncbi:MAG: hypothetical protein JSU00_08620 [Acidobacteria bacterium]|nr:hypothetical protein [Acidobacteriota bacterium]
MRPGLFLLPLACALAQDLPLRFDLPDADPVIVKAAQPAKFLESVGRRAALLGREDGSFEAWINPIKIVRDFRLSAYFDGSLEPAPLASLAEQVRVSPGRSTIVYAHAAFTVREHWIAPLDLPALIVLLDIDTDRPLKLRATFVPEFKPMWPASFGGQSSYWNEPERLFVFGEGLRRHAAVLGSPAFVRSSEQVGHQLPDVTMLAEMDITPDVARSHLIPIVIAASSGGSAGARGIYRDVLARLPELIRESDGYYREFSRRTFRLETPSRELNHAFEQARYAIEKGWACNEGVGCGLVAGYAPSGTSERPGFAWYFGGDALMNSWSIVDYGDFPRARAVLEFLRDRQRPDGKIMHELTQSAALLDWSKYPYGYYHGDTTPLFLFSIAEYVTRSGDLEFLKASWPAVDIAYRFCLGMLDDDGLMSNAKAGAGAVETGALSGKVAKDVYLAGAWLAGLDGYRRLAELAGRQADSRDAAARLIHARQSMNAWFLPDKARLPFARLTDGSLYDAQSSWQSFALAYGGLDESLSRKAAAALARPELATAWGTRLFATDSPYYDPLSYNDGSVWPFVTGFAISAQFAHHQAAAGLRCLYGLASTTDWPGAGFIAEYMSGNRAQALPRAVPHQLFSSSAVVRGAVSGLLGLRGDALARTVTVAPHIPIAWNHVKFENYRVGSSVIAGELIRKEGKLLIRLSIEGPPLDVTLSPAFPPASQSRGEGVVSDNGADLHVTIVRKAARQLDVTFDIAPGPEAPPELRAPVVGERASPR